VDFDINISEPLHPAILALNKAEVAGSFPKEARTMFTASHYVIPTPLCHSRGGGNPDLIPKVCDYRLDPAKRDDRIKDRFRFMILK